MIIPFTRMDRGEANNYYDHLIFTIQKKKINPTLHPLFKRKKSTLFKTIVGVLLMLIPSSQTQHVL